MNIKITGPAGCGKTTMAQKIERELLLEGKSVLMIEDRYVSKEIKNKFDVVIETYLHE